VNSFEGVELSLKCLVVTNVVTTVEDLTRVDVDAHILEHGSGGTVDHILRRVDVFTPEKVIDTLSGVIGVVTKDYPVKAEGNVS
jgi:hypothetical protein